MRGCRRRVVQMVQKRYPSSELLAAGWSLGGNILVRYLGEEGRNCPISAAASLCNPLDLVSNPVGLLHCPSGNDTHLKAPGPGEHSCWPASLSLGQWHGCWQPQLHDCSNHKLTTVTMYVHAVVHICQINTASSSTQLTCFKHPAAPS